MREKRKIIYKLNADVLEKLMIKRRWNIAKLAKKAGITRVQIWKMSLPPEDSRFSGAGSKAIDCLSALFSEAENEGLFSVLE